jgi:protein SCO1/2
MAQQIRGALEELHAQNSAAAPSAPSALAVSIDPQRDTPARVRSFLRRVSLASRLEYLTGTPAQLRAVWRAYEIVPPHGPRDRGPDRSAYVLLLDKHGSQRVRFYVEQLTPEGLAHDIRRLEGG